MAVLARNILFRTAALIVGAGVVLALLRCMPFKSGEAKAARPVADMDVVNACPAPLTPYGEPLAADTLSNLRIGPDVANLDYRFRSSRSGTIESVRVYVKTGKGYSGGDGGRMKIDVVPDDNGQSGKQVLGSAFASDMLRGPFNRVFTFERPVSLAAGSYYHLIFSNPSSDSTVDFVSINNLLQSGGMDTELRDASVMTRTDLHSSLVLRPELIPIFALQYSTGEMQGQGFIDALSESGRFRVIGDRRVRERMKLGDANMSTKQVRVRVRNPGDSPADLNIRVEQDGGPLLDEGNALVGGGTNYDWVNVDLSKAVTLKSRGSYNIVLSSRRGVDLFPLQGGARHGFKVPTLLTDSVYESSSGGQWNSPERELQMQLYFCK